MSFRSDLIERMQMYAAKASARVRRLEDLVSEGWADPETERELQMAREALYNHKRFLQGAR